MKSIFQELNQFPQFQQKKISMTPWWFNKYFKTIVSDVKENRNRTNVSIAIFFVGLLKDNDFKTY